MPEAWGGFGMLGGVCSHPKKELCEHFLCLTLDSHSLKNAGRVSLRA